MPLRQDEICEVKAIAEEIFKGRADSLKKELRAFEKKLEAENKELIAQAFGKAIEDLKKSLKEEIRANLPPDKPKK